MIWIILSMLTLSSHLTLTVCGEMSCVHGFVENAEKALNRKSPIFFQTFRKSSGSFGMATMIQLPENGLSPTT